jgi:uncharacterized protein YndB with AHSA1/START domain
MNVDVGVRRRFSCSPEQVFAVLRDGWIYPVWVVGGSRMRDVEAGSPAPGTKLHHSFGMWPLLLDDTTEVLEIEPGQRLVLEAGGWPVGKARVEITVDADAGGSLVSIAEDVTDGPAQLVPQPVRVAGIDVLNRETLRRLAYLAGTPHVSSHPRLATRSSFDRAAGPPPQGGVGSCDCVRSSAGPFKTS